MIHRRNYNAVVQLADGRAVTGKPSAHSAVTWQDVGIDQCQVRTRMFVDILAAQMDNGRVLVSIEIGQPLVDITSVIDELLGNDAKSTRGIYFSGDTVIVVAGRQIGGINVDRDGRATVCTHITFESDIDLIGLDYHCGHAVVRTINDQLYIINRLYPIIGLNDAVVGLMREIVLDNTRNISKMLSRGGHFFILMYDGRVYTCSCYTDKDNTNPFKQLIFPENESVSKIIDSEYRVIYLTDKGNCYHTALSRMPCYNRRPAVLRGLPNMVIENVFWIGDHLPIGIIQHDGQKLTRFTLSCRANAPEGHIPPCKSHSLYYKCDCFDTAVRIRPLTFFDDKQIASLVRIREGCTCFVTDEGRMYSVDNIDDEPIIRRDTFFDANPIAIKRGGQCIPSTGSMLMQ